MPLPRPTIRVSILVIDDDEPSQRALKQILDSEGWRVRVVPAADQVLAELAHGDWALVIASVSLTGVSGPVFSILRDLALASPSEGATARLRVLFTVPEAASAEAEPALERARLPYALKPFQFNDFLEKVSDLLLETGAIAAPIRRVRPTLKPPARRKEMQTGPARRDTQMFSSRDDYTMTEEEIAEYEQQEEEKKRKKKKQQDVL